MNEREDIVLPTAESLGEWFVAEANKRASGVNHVESVLRPYVFTVLRLLDLLGAGFEGISGYGIYWLIYPGIDEADLATIKKAFKNSPRVVEMVQVQYNISNTGSANERAFGTVLQVLTGKCPRKVSEPIDWLKDMVEVKGNTPTSSS